MSASRFADRPKNKTARRLTAARRIIIPRPHPSKPGRAPEAYLPPELCPAWFVKLWLPSDAVEPDSCRPG